MLSKDAFRHLACFILWKIGWEASNVQATFPKTRKQTESNEKEETKQTKNQKKHRKKDMENHAKTTKELKK